MRCVYLANMASEDEAYLEKNLAAHTTDITPSTVLTRETDTADGHASTDMSQHLSLDKR